MHLVYSFFLSSLIEAFLLITVSAVSSVVFIYGIKKCKLCLKIRDIKAPSDRLTCSKVVQKTITLHLSVCGSKLMNNTRLTSVEIEFLYLKPDTEQAAAA